LTTALACVGNFNSSVTADVVCATTVDPGKAQDGEERNRGEESKQHLTSDPHEQQQEMGQSIAKSLRALYKGEDVRILILGLDAAGKTTMLYRMKVRVLLRLASSCLHAWPHTMPLVSRTLAQLGEVVTTIPTIGFNVEQVKHRNVDLVVWDVGGRDKIRPLWRHYYHNTSAIIYVVDSNDRERLEHAKEEIEQNMSEDELRGAIRLIFANKQDLPNAASVQEISDALDLPNTLRGVSWNIMPCSAVKGDGITDGLEWLSDALAKGKAQRDIHAASAGKLTADTASKGKPSGILGSLLHHVKGLVFV
jgi:small GTP-binding protein